MRLWPFDDGFSLAEAEAVHAGGKSMIDSLSSLVTRSVVIADTTRRPTRYRLLETVRAYCASTIPTRVAASRRTPGGCSAAGSQHWVRRSVSADCAVRPKPSASEHLETRC